MSDKNLIDRATMAYHLRCVRKGQIFSQPDKGLSGVEDDIIVLRNRNGVVARYRWTYKDLRFVEDSGKEDQPHA